MLAPILAQGVPDGWSVVNGLSVLLALALSAFAFIRQVTGKGSERQIEPTQIAALSQQISGVSEKLSTMNRELGEVRTIGSRTEDAVLRLNQKQHEDISGAHKRIDGVSERVAALEATQ